VKARNFVALEISDEDFMAIKVAVKAAVVALALIPSSVWMPRTFTLLL
jgi:hypothetical protein